MFNRFQEGCVEENTNTATLVRRLLSDDYADKVIVTTIQKLGLALDEQNATVKQIDGDIQTLKTIIDHNNPRFGTNHSINEFDVHYKDVQQRIKDQQHPNADLSLKGAEKLDFTIIVDMLLTGFDGKYLKTLYLDKSLKISGEQLIGLIESDAKFLDEREEIAEYVRSLETGTGLDEKQVKHGYQQFKARKQAKELADLAAKHGLPPQDSRRTRSK